MCVCVCACACVTGFVCVGVCVDKPARVWGDNFLLPPLHTHAHTPTRTLSHSLSPHLVPILWLHQEPFANLIVTTSTTTTAATTLTTAATTVPKFNLRYVKSFKRLTEPFVSSFPPLGQNIHRGQLFRCLSYK